MIVISVIIPTRNRAAVLDRTMRSLCRQDLHPSSFEVLVVDDDSHDNTRQITAAFADELNVIAVRQPQRRGPAAARNAGAARASGGLLLFLDDDMECQPQLLTEHLNAHSPEGETVVVGHFPMQPPEPRDTLFTRSARLWWADRFNAMQSPGHRFSFWDFCTGNISLSKNLFEAAGGFDERIDQRGAGEDYELGLRLIASGAQFRYCRGAAAVHHTAVTLDNNLRRAEEEGFGQSMLVRKHPELFWQFNISRLSRLSESVVLRPVWRLLWSRPALAAPGAALLRATVRMFERMHLQSFLWRSHNVLRGYAYWKGVRAALGSLAAWERIAQDAPLEPFDFSETDLDILYDLSDIDAIFTQRRIDAVRVSYGGQPLGRIGPWAGAEPLRPEHIRNLLVQRFSSALLSVVVQTHSSGTETSRAGAVLAGRPSQARHQLR